MKVIVWFVRHPVATMLLLVSAVLSGLLALPRLPVSDLPDVDLPVISVTASQAGGSPEVMARTMAAPLERRLGNIAGVTQMVSTSSRGRTQISLGFALGRDLNGAARDVEAALRAARMDLPTTPGSDPQYHRANPNATPVLILAVTPGMQPLSQLHNLVNTTLRPMLLQVQGVGDVTLVGSSDPAVRVAMNPLAFFKYGIGFEDLRAALASANAHTPKGVIDQGNRRYQLAVNDQAEQAAAYRDLVIAYKNGHPVRLADVATVTDSMQDVNAAAFFDGKPALTLMVRAQPGANLVGIVDAVRARLPQLRTLMPPGADIAVARDGSAVIRSSLHHTMVTLLLACLLALGVVWAFLRSWTASIAAAIIVPCGLAASLGPMKLAGFGLDNLSLMALTVVTGLVVDDAIVVIENIMRHRARGLSPEDAAIAGAGEVLFTLLSITVSVLAVFLPIGLASGLTGRLFREFAGTVGIAVIVSLVLSCMATPCLTALCMRLAEARGIGGRRPRHADVAALLAHEKQRGSLYRRTLAFCVAHPGRSALLLPLTLALGVALFVRMPKIVFPRQDIGIVSGGSRATGSSVAQTKARLERFSRVLLADPGVAHVIAYLDTDEGSSHGMLFATLRDRSTGRDPAPVIAARAAARMGRDIHAEYHAQAPGNLMMRVGSNSSGLSYILRSDDDRLLSPVTRRLAQALRHHPEFTTVDPDIDPPGQGITLAIDRDTAARVGVTPQVIGHTLSDALGQTTASVVYTPQGQYNVVMTVQDRFLRDPAILQQFWISPSGGSASGRSASNTVRVATSAAAGTAFRNQIANSLAGGANVSTGSAVATGAETLVPLSVVTRITPSLDPVAVTHLGYASSASLALELAPGVSQSQVETIIGAERLALHLPDAVGGELQSDEGDLGRNTYDTEILIGGAILAVYLTLGMLYENVLHPLTILSTIPSAGVGAVIALGLFGLPFSGMAAIAMLLLTGISLKNAILLVDFAIHAERAQGLTEKEAIQQACLLRLRPIVMTSCAAALGALPLVLMGGYGMELRQPLGIALIGGLVVSQAQTMFTTPALYLLVARMAAWGTRRPRAADRRMSM
ncbi:transport system membrane protein [Gluconacetobacter liquefaciens]|uniref:Multidrug efflux pump n=1 Tax=Gluconacetobacter liquefaciens TaxID=89584 RepID=A0A370G237_GLULI|nr:efflux RND transporter permease subunit [Gluconacetobacter liquefaciens]MBB2188019.1 multidrug transporter [Gluconacetobacter liquefaciens]RDI36123.1 multidrug efflux pump [Gluconacetobacter liquefaciens]GEB38715.1 transport system membrane protein [Gluconacetobacter liquefaciens]